MSRRSLKILLVEDDTDTRVALESFMESLGHLVTSVSDLEQARIKMHEESYEFLLCDIGLPDGTGWELLRRSSFPGTFAVAMSGFGLNADAVRSREAGFRYHLLKPFDPAKLEDMLKEAGRRLQD